MSIVPVLLDHRLANARGDGADVSLLLLPAPDMALVQEIMRAVRQITAYPPSVLPSFRADDAYGERLAAECRTFGRVLTAGSLREMIGRLDAGDSLLLIDPKCYPLEGLSLGALCETSAFEAHMARHLLGLEASASGIKEMVHEGEEGRIRRVQRYYHPVTWPFPTGVMASFVPLACLQTARDLAITSLEDLRRALAARGVPSEDVPLRGECVELVDEGGALALIERRVRAMWQAESTPRTGKVRGAMVRGAMVRGEVAEGARLAGPVVVGVGARIEAGALIVGPAVIGDGARVGAGAVVAQCLVLPGATIQAGASLRHRVIVNRVDREGERTEQRNTIRNVRTIPAGGDAPVLHATYPVVKALVEPIIALAALVALAPVLLLAALMVRLDSPGSIFYGDRREGRGGRPFRCWKFRSMRTDANDLQPMLAAQQQLDGPQFKMDRDPRVTRVGRWLRQLNVDELPQLWNVVLGQMSFVGPRPSPFRENQICVPWRNGRLSVQPGITGLWQVCRRDRALGDFHQWIRYDLLYVRHMSFLVDVKILAATLVTLGGRRPVSVERILPLDATPPTKRRPVLELASRPIRVDPRSRASDASSVLHWARRQAPGFTPWKESAEPSRRAEAKKEVS
jgi:lipopolysaccharide/colanic/teichoic acid biosynthesis glycosyltransferase